MDFRDIKEFVSDALKYVITAVVVVVIIIYVITIQQVIGPSMQPTLNDQDIVLLNKIHYRLFSIKRFEVVALKYDGTKYLIKRVIGMPGDTIEYKNNQLYINSTIIEETFLEDDVITDDFSIAELGYDVIPDDMYLVLGDNRQDSLDSRDIGLIPKKDILGKVIVRFWPINDMKLVR